MLTTSQRATLRELRGNYATLGQWLDDAEAAASSQQLVLGQVDHTSWVSSLARESGWRACVAYLRSSLSEAPVYDDFSLTKPINNAE